MKAIVIDGYGGVDRLSLRDVPRPRPADREVLIRIRASSVNPIDWKLRAGKLRLIHPIKFPAILGFDLAGEVVGRGSGAGKFKDGQRVYARSNKPSGEAYAEFIALEESYVAPCPDGMSFEEAAAIPLAGLTALQALRDHGGIDSGQQVLVNGASGGVGSYAVQIAKACGAIVTGVCGPANVDLVRRFGADHVIDYRSQDPLGGDRKYDIIFDAVATLSFGKARSCMQPNSHFVTTVPGPGVIAAIAIGNVFSRKKASTIMVKPNGADLEYLTGLANAGKLRSEIHKVFGLAEAGAAHLESEGGRARGKIVIRI